MTGLRNKVGGVFSKTPDLIAELSRTNPDESIVMHGILNGSDVEACDTSGASVLTLCIIASMDKAVGLLLDKPVAYNPVAVLSLAVCHRRYDLLKQLLERPSFRNAVNMSDRYGQTPLCHAADCIGGAYVELFLQAGADVNQQNKNGETPLIVAICVNEDSVIESLLKSGADPYIKDKRGYDAFDHASIYQSLVFRGTGERMDRISLLKPYRRDPAPSKPAGREFQL